MVFLTVLTGFIKGIAVLANINVVKIALSKEEFVISMIPIKSLSRKK